MIAILSDIHSNLAALTHTLDILKEENITDIYCAGDLLEYPGNANEIIRILQQYKVKSVLGNNDASYLDRMGFAPDDDDEMPEELTADSIDFLENLPEFISEEDFYMVHGLPPFSLLKYIDRQSDEELIKAFSSFTQSVAFVGHTHEFKVYELTALGKNQKHELTDQPFCLKLNSRYIINTGNIGFPREAKNEAGFILYNPESKEIFRESLSE